MHGLKRHSLVTLQLVPVVEAHSPSIQACAPVPIADLPARYSIYVLMHACRASITSAIGKLYSGDNKPSYDHDPEILLHLTSLVLRKEIPSKDSFKRTTQVGDLV